MGDLEQLDKDWLQLIKKGRNEKFDFVENTNDSSLILRIISSFVNSEGGNLLIGVNNKLKIIGVSPQEMILELTDLFKDYSLLNNIEFHTIYISHYILLRINVVSSTEKIALFENGKKNFYYRIGQTIVLANKIILRYWRMKSSPKTLNCNAENMEVLLTLFSYGKQLSLAKMYKETKTSLTKKEVDHAVSCLLYIRKLSILFHDDTVFFKTKKD